MMKKSSIIQQYDYYVGIYRHNMLQLQHEPRQSNRFRGIAAWAASKARTFGTVLEYSKEQLSKDLYIEQ